MPKMLIAYYSRGGNTRKMAELVHAGAAAANGVQVDLKPIAEVEPGSLLGYDAIVLGSPTYYGLPAAELKRLLDDSVALHGQLEGKVGGAFASSANIGGGNETTILAILQALLIHGMVVPGVPMGDHYGPVAIGAPDRRAGTQCREYGKRLAAITKKLHG
ncbi:MAG TPA: NAD(P)H-dependent oxidoreductase [Planctomycetota bacterium]|nr:NAD(P)H-dependent oxidoreductase [Planctomycetota bacterium]